MVHTCSSYRPLHCLNTAPRFLTMAVGSHEYLPSIAAISVESFGLTFVSQYSCQSANPVRM